MNFPILIQFARQDLVDRHATSVLGVFWTFLLPLVNILIFTFVFSNIMGLRLTDMGMEDLGKYSYSAYLIVGLLAWICFSNTFSRSTHVFHEKAPLIAKVNIPLFTLPIYILISETIIYLIAMSFFSIFLFFIDSGWSIYWLWWPLIFFVQQLLAYAIGLLCAILSVFIKDIKELVGVLVQFWFWMTPIVYVITILPEKWHALFMYNPFYHIVNAYRDIMLLDKNPSFIPLLIISTVAVAILLTALFLGKKLERDIRDFL